MPEHTYVATTLTVRNMRSEERLPVANLDGRGLDLVDLFYAFAQAGVEEGSWDDTKRELIVTPTAVVAAGRTVRLEHESGHYGSDGRLRHRKSNTFSTYSSDEAPVLPRRSMMVVPEAGEYAVCLSERVRSASLPSLFWREFRKAVRQKHGVLVDISSTVDGVAWEGLLSNATALHEITYIETPHDLAEGPVREVPLNLRRRYSVGAATSDSLPLSYLPRLLSDRKARQQVAKLVLVPEDFGDDPEVTVVVEEGRSTRRITIDKDWPAFIYHFGGKPGVPSLTVFESDVRRTAAHLLEQLDCPLPTDWRNSAWTADRLAQRLKSEVISDDDVDPDEVDL